MEPDSALRSICICVELDPDFFYLMQSYAQRSGIGSLQLCRAADAVECTRRTQPAMIFLDADTPGAPTAWDLLRVLKAAAETQSIPVALLSWINQRELALEEGADVYVQKPVMFGDFLQVLTLAGVPYRLSAEGGDAVPQT